MAWWEDAGLATWILAAIGFFGTIAAVWTLITLRSQTLALLSGTCAWLIVEVEWMDGRSPLSYVDTEDGAHTTLCANLICKNYGQTPAWITQKFFTFQIGHPVAKFSDRSSGYDVDLETIPADKESRHTIKLSCRGRIEQDKKGIFWGVVDYKDVFRRKRHARFIYGIGPDGELECMSEAPRYVDGLWHTMAVRVRRILSEVRELSGRR